LPRNCSGEGCRSIQLLFSSPRSEKYSKVNTECHSGLSKMTGECHLRFEQNPHHSKGPYCSSWSSKHPTILSFIGQSTDHTHTHTHTQISLEPNAHWSYVKASSNQFLLAAGIERH
jgi:hypothetical protein